MKLLVIGARGFLGSHLTHSFRSSRHTVLTASHQEPADCHIDLRDPNSTISPALLENTDYMILCSYLTNIDRCKHEADASWQMNVASPIRLFEQARSHGVTPVFISSDAVFDGTAGNYRETDERNPSTTYGKQKKEVEDRLLDLESPSVITRLSKVFTTQYDRRCVVHNWVESWRSNETIQCATDQTMTLTHTGDFCRILEQLLQESLTGIFHISTRTLYSRFELARSIAKALNLPEELVQPCRLADLRLEEPRPLNSTLNSDKVRERMAPPRELVELMGQPEWSRQMLQVPQDT